MTPTPTTFVGVIEDGAVAVVEGNDAGSSQRVAELRYPRHRPLRDGPSGASDESVGGYLIPTTPLLAVVLVRSESGWIARAPEVGALGYGDTGKAAVEHLADAVGEYLEFLRDEAPALAPEIAHHRDFLPLLKLPLALWIGSVGVDASAVE